MAGAGRAAAGAAIRAAAVAASSVAILHRGLRREGTIPKIPFDAWESELEARWTGQTDGEKCAVGEGRRLNAA